MCTRALSCFGSQFCAPALMRRRRRAKTRGTRRSTTAAMEHVTDNGMSTAYTCCVVNMSDHTVSSSAGPSAMALDRSKKGRRACSRGGR